MIEASRSEIDKVRDAIGVYRSCEEADELYYKAIDVIVDYAEQTIVTERRADV